MSRRVIVIVSVVVWLLTLGSYASARMTEEAQQRQGAAAEDSAIDRGWTVPPTAADEKNPLAVNDAVLANGKKLFNSKCRRCHGPNGKGDGEDAEEKHRKDMDLTTVARAARNPDGVVFYKVSNGRMNPKMPRFSEELSKEQIWAIVAYVQTLRVKQ